MSNDVSRIVQVDGLPQGQLEHRIFRDLDG